MQHISHYSDWCYRLKAEMFTKYMIIAHLVLLAAIAIAYLLTHF